MDTPHPRTPRGRARSCHGGRGRGTRCGHQTHRKPLRAGRPEPVPAPRLPERRGRGAPPRLADGETPRTRAPPGPG
eukprot:3694728-Alexandrium_andersonii.AAC.1